MLKTKFKYLTYFFSFLVSTSLAGCSTVAPNYKTVGNLNSLSQLQDLHAKVMPAKKADMNKLHVQALQDVAMSVGAQAGLAWRSKNINALLTKSASDLDHIFNFNLMLLEHNVVPPVLVQGNSSLNLADPQTLRIDDRVYQIVSQAHFTTTPPQWHNYLWMDYQAPDMPLPAFLPKTAEERAIWRNYATLGWQDGINQANSIFSDNLARLTRDYTGMALYRSLLLKGMVSKPFVAQTDLGVTGDDSNLHINDQIFRITSLPKLQPKASQWNPVITHDNSPTQQ
ncbi:type IV secretory system conjugative DNA transfer family protein [Candidatus Rickettsiella viridis]|uniref:type IV secretory system conjugative DNA transfer family protein n=1 Tax=Candidatus Rickettsiella viridis TaxID=676208 RepID=UPI000F83D939|nr:type IV secretory system conjugative DNA transfer family protein [Candidatus Rickettsiella viridis]